MRRTCEISQRSEANGTVLAPKISNDLGDSQLCEGINTSTVLANPVISALVQLRKTRTLL